MGIQKRQIETEQIMQRSKENDNNNKKTQIHKAQHENLMIEKHEPQ